MHFCLDIIYVDLILWLLFILIHLFFFDTNFLFLTFLCNLHHFLLFIHQELPYYLLLELSLSWALNRGIDLHVIHLFFIVIYQLFRCFRLILKVFVIILFVNLNFIFNISSVLPFYRVLLNFSSKLIIFSCNYKHHWDLGLN